MLTYSVITICRNAAATIERTIRSVLRQDPPPLAYVFVDAASTDGTVEVIRGTLRDGVPAGLRVSIMPQHEAAGAAGIPAAWNQGVARADGDVIFILNADDWYEPDAARTVLEAFAMPPAADIVVSPIRYRQTESSATLRVQNSRGLWLLPVLMPVPHPGCFVRRTVYERTGDFDERYTVSADYDFIYRAARAGCRFRFLDTPLVNMQPGGFARTRLHVARRETRDIGRCHARLPLLPWLAYGLRVLLRR